MIKGMIYQYNIYSQYLRQFIERGYNRVVERYGGEPISIVAYWGIGNLEKKEAEDIYVITTNEARKLIANGEI